MNNMNNIKENDFVWYFKNFWQNDNIDFIKTVNVNRSKVLSIKIEPQYHNIIEYIYTLENGETISNINYNIYDNEDIAIEKYNN